MLNFSDLVKTTIKEHKAKNAPYLKKDKYCHFFMVLKLVLKSFYLSLFIFFLILHFIVGRKFRSLIIDI